MEVTAMRSLRCWLLGHEWIATLVEETVEGDRKTRIATCPRCGTATAFVDGDRDSDEVSDD